jgi:hypothetical protein
LSADFVSREKPVVDWIKAFKKYRYGNNESHFHYHHEGALLKSGQNVSKRASC